MAARRPPARADHEIRWGGIWGVRGSASATSLAMPTAVAGEDQLPVGNGLPDNVGDRRRSNSKE